MQLSIITATYNRAYCLDNIYQSILRNKYHEEIEWILVDDGSSDNTRELANKWIKEDKINFRFYTKPNGGKTRAIKLGFDNNPKGKYTFVLDSDDYLADNAIEIILDNLKNLDEKYIGILGLKAFTNGKVVGDKFNNHESNYINLYFGKNAINSDKLFIIRTDIYKKSYELPLNNEKFMPDNIPYINANSEGYYRLINEILYYGEYLDDGMTNNVFKMAMNNINCYIYEKKRLQAEKLSPKFTILNTVKYIHYSILAKKNLIEIVKQSNQKKLTLLLYLPVGVGLYPYRKKMLKTIKD
ncbi:MULTISPECIES: glycosyltransferase family 2 protein [unclassified Moraxella]|uniref:glycosyltransferase family 2 protein n=1 Tax=unclassified Moraxella TaxID=2685852 RepID=UPI003AF8D61E